MRGEEARISRTSRGRQTNPMSPGGAEVERAVAEYVDRFFKQTVGDYAQLREKVDTLTGEKGSRGARAMRAEPIEQMLEVIQSLPVSRVVSAAPTADEHNALVQDVHAIYAGLAALRYLLIKP